jgi:TonB C terminal
MEWVNLEEASPAGPSDEDNGNNIRARALADSPLRSVTLSELPAEIRANYPKHRPGNERTGGDAPRPANLSDEMVERSTVTGVYISQIKAEIDRAWLRPRTPLDVPLFSCRARIAQDSTGTVREVTLELCTADARWQQSLLRAIQSASPLPAPPDPRVFTSVLRITFESESYSPTARPGQYEPSLTDSADQPPALPAIQRDRGT